MNYEQELKELMKAGKRLRAAQTTYFANSKSLSAFKYLDKAKEQEREFDSRLVKLQFDLTQPKFDL